MERGKHQQSKLYSLARARHCLPRLIVQYRDKPAYLDSSDKFAKLVDDARVIQLHLVDNPRRTDCSAQYLSWERPSLFCTAESNRPGNSQAAPE